MVRLFVVLGLALLAGGAYAIVDGWPYLVLERGFTEVILGALAAIAGLILLALAVVLAEVRRLKALVSGVMATAAPVEPRYEPGPPADVAPARAEPTLERERQPETGHVGIATTLAAGAGAAVLAGALTGPARSEEQPAETATEDAQETSGTDDVRAADAPAEAEPPSPSATAETIDDWLLPPAPATLDAPAAVRADERREPEDIDRAAAAEEGEPLEPAAIGDAAPRPGDDGASGKGELADAAVSETRAEQAPVGGVEPTQAATPGPDEEDRPWWPRIDRPASEAAASVGDEFSALREQLVGAVDAPSAPEIAPPRRDRDALADFGGWAAPRPWPPVTQPRDPSALADLETEAAAKAPAAEAETAPAVAGEEPAAPEAETPDEPAEISAPAEAAPSAADEAAPVSETGPEQTPAASEEGVIGAYQVGETQFTMYADGSIHARTPDGDYTFASMDELKAYLASEKDKLEPRAGSDQIEPI
ncbi:hypothetical protein [Bosea sp. CS1GBMeth4]|uniref:hypothetical protein n=1 Tax=Bosea sp. CS1GBMeth4 TaxID=1892849 RepID=UPI001644005F|nr:hypothetical protein [Bosea sp. CS1GBMeth4]